MPEGEGDELVKPKDPPVYHHEDFDYIRFSEVPEEVREEFDRWMRGQTQPILPGEEPGNLAYAWDWERFKTVKAGKPVLWD